MASSISPVLHQQWVNSQSLQISPEYELYHGELTAGDQPLTQTVKLQAGTATLSGKLLDGNGKPVPKAKLHAQINELAEANMLAYVDIEVKDDGSFTTPLPDNVQLCLTAEVNSTSGRLGARTDFTAVHAGKNLAIDLKWVSELDA